MVGNIRLYQTQRQETWSNPFGLLWGTRQPLLITFLTCAASSSALTAGDVKRTHGSLTMINRSITQDQGAWVVDYRLRVYWQDRSRHHPG